MSAQRGVDAAAAGSRRDASLRREAAKVERRRCRGRLKSRHVYADEVLTPGDVGVPTWEVSLRILSERQLALESQKKGVSSRLS